MDDYAQIYWVPERNAGRDHRTQGGGGGGGAAAPWRPGAGGLAASGPAVPPPTASVYTPPPAYYPTQPPVYTQPGYYPVQPAYGQFVMQQPTTLGALFGGLTIGQIIEMIAQAIAALQSLPTAPVGTQDVEKDVGNLVLYQTAIAQHAKRDEQLRTLGSLISKLVR